ncbi:MAG TPA: hypothetical protein VJY39_22450 [Acidisphaera sp.]|nr:hypothetical protein [Acidisphaera sp.]
MTTKRNLQRWAGIALFIAAELILFGAAEGPQKWQWIMAGSVPNALLALGFVFF